MLVLSVVYMGVSRVSVACCGCKLLAQKE